MDSGTRVPITDFSVERGKCVAEDTPMDLRSFDHHERKDLGVWKRFSCRVLGANSVKYSSCDSRKYLRWHCPALLHNNPTIVMQHCPHNVVESVVNRYFKNTPQPNNIDWGLVDRIIDRVACRVAESYIPFDHEGYLSRKTGRVRQRYINAHNKILKEGFNLMRDSTIKAFVKLERYFELGKSPRMILGRDPKFNVFYSQLIEPIEQAFFKLPEVANGKDHHAVGEQFSNFNCEEFDENDMSKFESSQRWETLSIEYAFYLAVLTKLGFTELIPILELAFACCLVNKCVTSVGVVFSFLLCRVSGDLTTSLGNGIINMITSAYHQCMNTCNPRTCKFDVCENPKCRVKDILLKGDDSVLGKNAGQKTVNFYGCFGLDAKIVPRKCADEVEFCSGRFVEVSAGHYVYVQKVQKLVESLTTCINEDAVRRGWVGHYYKSLGLMYKVVYRGIPLYEDIADFLISTNDYGLNVNLIQSYNLLDAFNSEHKEVKIDQSMAKLGVAIANDMDGAEIDHLINYFRTHTLQLPDCFNKRCRVKSAKACDVPRVDFELINSQLSSRDFDKEHKKALSKVQRVTRCDGSLQRNWG